MTYNMPNVIDALYINPILINDDEKDSDDDEGDSLKDKVKKLLS